MAAGRGVDPQPIYHRPTRFQDGVLRRQESPAEIFLMAEGRGIEPLRLSPTSV